LGRPVRDVSETTRALRMVLRGQKPMFPETGPAKKKKKLDLREQVPERGKGSSDEKKKKREGCCTNGATTMSFWTDAKNTRSRGNTRDNEHVRIIQKNSARELESD